MVKNIFNAKGRYILNITLNCDAPSISAASLYPKDKLLKYAKKSKKYILVKLDLLIHSPTNVSYKRMERIKLTVAGIVPTIGVAIRNTTIAYKKVDALFLYIAHK